MIKRKRIKMGYKTKILFVLLILSHDACFGQISSLLNAPRGEDAIVRHTIELHQSGEEGKGIVWDISELTVKRKKYYRRHMQEGENPDSISAIDRSTKYYYNVLDAGIYEIGYENNQTKVSSSSSSVHCSLGITPLWVQGLKNSGITPYAPSGAYNTRIVPVNIDSPATTLMRAYPRLHKLPANYTLRSNPRFYYKR